MTNSPDLMVTFAPLSIDTIDLGQIWKEAASASIVLCKQEDAEFFKVDEMLSDLQKGDTYFAGCVLFGF